MKEVKDTLIYNFGYIVEKNRNLYHNKVAIEDLTKQTLHHFEIY